MSTSVARHDASVPNSALANVDSPSENIMTPRSIRTSAARGTLAGITSLSTSRDQLARRIPSPPPAAASNRLSVTRSRRAAQGTVQKEPNQPDIRTALPPALLEDLKKKGILTDEGSGPVVVGNIDPKLAAAAQMFNTGKLSPQSGQPDFLNLPLLPLPSGPPTITVPWDPFGTSTWSLLNMKPVAPVKPAPAPKASPHPQPKVAPPAAAAPDLVSRDGLTVSQAQIDSLDGDALLAEMSKTLDWLRANKVSSQKADAVGRYYSALSALYRQQKEEIELRRGFYGRRRSISRQVADAEASLALKSQLAERFPAMAQQWEVPVQIIKPEDRTGDLEVTDPGITLSSTGVAKSGDDITLGLTTRNLDPRYLDNFTNISVDPWTHDYVAWFPDGTQVAIPRNLIDDKATDGSYEINTPGGVREFMPKAGVINPVTLPPNSRKVAFRFPPFP
jgi:hypothetical protein